MTKMTAATVEKLKPGEKRIERPDTVVKGLVLVVQPTGAKSWQLRYRTAGVRRRLVIGSYPAVSLAEARKAAQIGLTSVLEGQDPVADRNALKRAGGSGEDTVAVLIEQYAKRHLANLKSGKTVQRELERHVVALWGDRVIQNIKRRDVIDLLDGIADSGRVVTANRVRAYLNKFLAWCVERDIIAGSPAIGIKPVAKEKSRDRKLSDDEIKWFWQACNSMGQPWGHLGKILLLTGQRLGEVVNMTDQELDGDIWRLKGERTKNGRAHDVALSQAALKVLDDVERIRGDAGFLFTTTGEGALQGYHKGKNYIASRMIEMASLERGEDVDIPHWTFHDLRRTAASGMAKLGIPVRVTEAVLNHVSGTGGGIVAVYQVHDFADEKRAALDAWAQYLSGLVAPRISNVTPIKRAKYGG